MKDADDGIVDRVMTIVGQPFGLITWKSVVIHKDAVRMFHAPHPGAG